MCLLLESNSCSANFLDSITTSIYTTFLQYVSAISQYLKLFTNFLLLHLVVIFFQ